MPEPVLEVRDLTVHFYTYAGIVKAIEGVSFDVYRGETFALVGETGCGKSVTSRALTQLIESPGRIVRGKVIYHREDGSTVDLLKLSEEEIREIRGKEIAYIFQDPHASLDPLYTVGYQIAEAMVVHRTVKDWKEGFRRAVDILRRVLIPDPENRVKNYPHELSGGMKQRVVIGIGVSNDPKILIADEPTTALDVTVQAQILDLMNKLKKEYNTTVILITHNMGVVAEMADRVAVMYAGKIVEIGSVDQIFKNPLHPYTKGLLRAVPNPLAKIERLEAIPGTVPNLITPPKGCRFHPRCPYATEICRKEVPKLKEIEPGHFVACHLY
ncbi:ABC transporter ATP-binding protein [Thermococcus gammatolerans]|uniref:Nickel import system ATP-binding protein NikD n=1 Tax=Thermococcus gammatolerans (strain DSM 15229 / JCM 11827 / EJ3) TaxID=593117 RepID=C5A563_THEGJ|nr:ABC transporter ATP-binding protein [Thermococcus gammatolerans]ACS33375.1 ABC-type dipeptide/oligopeptide transport system, ATPase component (dppD/oppD) [Thermococcus gammatolerans EJ3]